MMPSRIRRALPSSYPLLIALFALLLCACCGASAEPLPRATAAPTSTPPAAPASVGSPEPSSTPHIPGAAPAGSTMPPIPETLVSPPPTRPLTLDEAVQTALQHNPQVLAQRKTVEVAVWRMRQQYAGYYPSVDVSASQVHTESQNTVFIAGQATSANAVGTNADITTKRDNSSIQLNATQTLIDFGQRTFKVRQAEQTLEASRQDLVRTEQDVTLSVRQAYYTAFVKQVLVDIQRQTVESREQHLRQSEGFYEAGVRAKNEVTKARADLAQAQLDLVRAIGTLRTSWVNLNVAMGMPRDITYELTVEKISTISADLDRDRLLATALAQRPDLRNLQARIRSQIFALQEIYAQRYPTISATAGYGYAGPPSPLDQAWSVGVRLNWNLFNGFLSHFQANEARASAEVLLLQLEQTRQQVYQQVENDYITFEQARTAIDAARVSLENAQENYRLAQERYQVGLGSNLEFIDAQVLLAQAQTALATAENDFRTARAQLEHDVGVYTVDALPAPAPPVIPDKIPGSKIQLPTVP